MKIAVPGSFSLRCTALSHGWFDLPPFRWDAERAVLGRVLTVAPGRHLLAEIRQPSTGALDVRVRPAPGGESRRLSKDEGRALLRQVRHMLRLDESVDAFHALCRRRPGFRWIAGAKAGRLLRAPEPFEDLIKLICTTNCSWGMTRLMVEALVSRLGEPVAARPASSRPQHPEGGWRSFPTPESMASAPGRFYARTVRAGYRAPFLKELAERVAGGRTDPSRWLDPDRPAAEIRREIEGIKGAGRYVAESMMKLLGRYEGLALDSWCRREFARRHRRGRRASDATIERHYISFGPWRGLALWCDLTRDWIVGGNAIPPELRRPER